MTQLRPVFLGQRKQLCFLKAIRFHMPLFLRCLVLRVHDGRLATTLSEPGVLVSMYRA